MVFNFKIHIRQKVELHKCDSFFCTSLYYAGSEEIVQIDEDVNKVLGVPIEEGDSLSVLMEKENGEIVDADNEEIVETVSEEIVETEKDVNKVHGIPVEEDDTKSVLKDRMNVYIRSDVRNAIETIERVISVVRKCGFFYFKHL